MSTTPDATAAAPDPRRPAPEPDVRPEDLPLHEDVRWLAATLGRVIRRLEGDEAFETVEALRRACRARRHGDAGAPDARRAARPRRRAAARPLRALTARAFTLFFLLINTAEQVHRVRRARDYRSAERRRAAARVRAVDDAAAARPRATRAEEVARAIARPRRAAGAHRASHRVHAAHAARAPGARRRPAAARASATPPSERARDRATRSRARSSCCGSPRRCATTGPSVLDEVSTVLWYLETRLLDASARARDALVRAFEEEFGDAPDARAAARCRCGSATGSAATATAIRSSRRRSTLAAARRASHAILGRYARGARRR